MKYKLTSGRHSRWEGPKKGEQKFVQYTANPNADRSAGNIIDLTPEEAKSLEGRVVPLEPPASVTEEKPTEKTPPEKTDKK